MYKGNRSRFFPIVVVIVIIAIVVFGLVSLVRLIFAGNNGGTESAEKTNSLSSKLLKTDEGQSVSMTVRGPIVADENFRSFEVTISPSERTITAWKGYDKLDVLSTKQYSNDTESYAQFVNALNYAGYTKSNKVDSNDTKGLCANGKVYSFEIMSGDTVTDNRWTTNCGVKGSFNGDGPSVRELFLDQIPNASSITSKINI